MDYKERSKQKVDFKRNMGVFAGLARPYKKYILLTVFFVVLISISRVAEKYVFKELIDYGTLFSAGQLGKEAFIGILVLLAAVYIGSSAIQISSNWLRFHFINRLENRMIYDLKTKFFNHILELSHSFHAKHRTGSLIARLTRGARAVETVADFLVFESLQLTIEFIVIFISIALFDLTSALVLLMMVTTFILYSAYLLHKQQKETVKKNVAEDIEKALVSDAFANIESIMYFGKEKIIKGRFAGKTAKTQRHLQNVWDYARWMVSGHGLIFVGFLLLLLYFPVTGFLEGRITIGAIVFIYTIYLNLAGPLSRFTWHLRAFYTAMADFHSLIGYADIEKEVKDAPGAKKLKISRGKINFKNVTFSYNKKKVVKNLSLEIRPNEKIALVGHSGSGKTTLVKLLYRLYDISRGKIKIDGQDISEVKQESLRGEMSIVPQEPILFNDTIKNNLLLSKPNASEKEILSAAKKAQFHKFMKELPKGMNTIVGERGVKLSGGEKQRLSIARAILAGKKILVLDEATSALDSKTEAEIQKALEKLMKGRTTIIIAHRLSTIMNADRIIVMDNGKIAQEGTHKELIKNKGIYKELWGLQRGGYLQE